MPMSFPTFESLKQRATIRNFRQPEENETEDQYRNAFANFMRDVDLVESAEIRSGQGWDKLDPGQLLVEALGKESVEELLNVLSTKSLLETFEEQLERAKIKNMCLVMNYGTFNKLHDQHFDEFVGHMLTVGTQNITEQQLQRGLLLETDGVKVYGLHDDNENNPYFSADTITLKDDEIIVQDNPT